MSSPNPSSSLAAKASAHLVSDLLSWFDVARRRLPWRAEAPQSVDPYRVWISEIMLQQTTVRGVVPYFEAFVARFPTLVSLASADLDAVLRIWQGLGYYARARHLHACARRVNECHGGQLPGTSDQLACLPGIGRYTAAAIAAIAFGERVAAVDGNVIRVLARFYGLSQPLPAVRREIERLAATLVPAERPGDFAQALMDLGATVCTPRRPACHRCPWTATCRAAALNRAEDFPVRALRKPRPTRHGVAFWIETQTGLVLLRRRPLKGLLGGMMEFPTTAWRETPWSLEEAIAAAPLSGNWYWLPGEVRHAFTHFLLTLPVAAQKVEAPQGATADKGVWWPIAELASQPLPKVMIKVWQAAIGDATMSARAGSDPRHRQVL